MDPTAPQAGMYLPGAPPPSMGECMPEPLTMQRRRELFALAEKLVTTAGESGVKGREWCFLRQACEMLTDR